MVTLCMLDSIVCLKNIVTNYPRHVLIDFREDGVTPFATLWKHGLKGNKV